MLKELSFERITDILKYLVLVFVLSVVGVLYNAKPNHGKSDSNDQGVVSGSVRSVESAPLPLGEENQGQVIEPAVLAKSNSMLSQSELVSDKVRLTFKAANEASRQGDFLTAKSLLAELIGQHPGLPEPYTNLAALQAANGQLTQARTTLLQGLKANKGYAALFSNLQQIQGALAANAYRAALTDQAQSITNLNLPMLEDVVLPGESLKLDGLNQVRQPAKRRELEEATPEQQEIEQPLKANN